MALGARRQFCAIVVGRQCPILWDAVCDRVDVHRIPGEHLALLRSPALAALAAAALNDALAATKAEF
jgi:hypothetical protein